jgi:hypothetical protein
MIMLRPWMPIDIFRIADRMATVRQLTPFLLGFNKEEPLRIGTASNKTARSLRLDLLYYHLKYQRVFREFIL